jgi:hypothetical protein
LSLNIENKINELINVLKDKISMWVRLLI